jgi:hypothetical protein
MQTQQHTMFSRRLTNEGHVRHFVISTAGLEGWDVLEEHDSHVVRQARYTDWHRVERARQLFTLRATVLTEDGWTDA